MTRLVDDVAATLQAAVEATGHSWRGSVADLAVYAAERADHLALAIGEPGYDRAVEAEVQNVALRGGIRAVDEADAVEARIVGIVTGTLRTLAAVAARSVAPPAGGAGAGSQPPTIADSTDGGTGTEV